jgi:hypothetical protein
MIGGLWFLGRLGPGHQRRNVEHFAVVFRLLLGPDHLHHLDPLTQLLESGFIRSSVVFHLLGVPSRPPETWHIETPGDRNVGVLRYPKRVKAALLERYREFGWRYRVFGKKIERQNPCVCPLVSYASLSDLGGRCPRPDGCVVRDLGAKTGVGRRIEQLLDRWWNEMLSNPRILRQ